MRSSLLALKGFCPLLAVRTCPSFVAVLPCVSKTQPLIDNDVVVRSRVAFEAE